MQVGFEWAKSQGLHKHEGPLALGFESGKSPWRESSALNVRSIKAITGFLKLALSSSFPSKGVHKIKASGNHQLTLARVKWAKCTCMISSEHVNLTLELKLQQLVCVIYIEVMLC